MPSLKSSLKSFNKASSRLKKTFKKFSKTSGFSNLSLISKTFAIGIALFGILFTAVVEAPLAHEAWMYRYVGEKIVKITNEAGNSGGTGFHLQLPDGHIVIMTNAHVCELGKDDGTVWVQSSLNPAFRLKRRILWNPGTTDLCIVEPLPDTPGLKIKDADLNPGDHVWILGHPRLYPLTKSEGQITGEDKLDVIGGWIGNDQDRKDCLKQPKNHVGQVDSFFGSMEACISTLPSYMSNALIFPGNSGSPVVDEWGRVVTVVYAGDSATNFGIFLSHSELMKFLAKQPF